MSNTRKLRSSLTVKPQVYHCAVCLKRFASLTDRQAHWKFIPGGRLCADTPTMQNVLKFRYSRGAWRR